MAACEGCGAVLTDGGTFTNEGKLVCKPCHSKEQIGAANARAEASAAAEGKTLKVQPPGKAILIGFALMGVAVLWLIAGLSMGKLYFYPFFLFGAGVVAVVRGVARRKQQ